MSEEVKLQKTSKRHTFPKGEAWNGNKAGRPRKPEVDLLREALAKAKEKHGKDFLQHFVERAFINDNVAIALAKKLISDKLQGEGFGDTNIFALVKRIQQEFIQENSKPSLGMDTGTRLHE